MNDETPHAQPSVADPDPAWRRSHRESLVQFARGARHPQGGFGWLDDAGRVVVERDVELWISCRMTHVFALALLEGDPDSANDLDYGIEALRTVLADQTYGGWHSTVGHPDGAKEAYPHAFVLLAAASAAQAGHPDARVLLDQAVEIHDQHFWHESDGMVVESWSHDWEHLDPYRGINANMHTVEALLAAHDLTGSSELLDRAYRITERVVNGFATGHDFRLPEHYSESWAPLLDYHRDEPAHPFRPYGVTIGHLLEWSRLALSLRAAMGAKAPDWLLSHARSLFAVAVRDGWAVDGADGFVYTVDFDARPVVTDRLHWVLTEAIGAAHALHEVTGEDSYLDAYHQWWNYAQRNLIDGRRSWRHELDASNRPANLVWHGRPDVYHAYQAALIADLSQPISFAGALRVNRP